MTRLLMTQSLLSAWQWAILRNNPDELLRALRRERTPPTRAMLDGRQFENMVWACACGSPPAEGHKWRRGILETARAVQGAAWQVKLYRDVTVLGVPFLFYGIADFIRAGTIYDTKFSASYGAGGRIQKYLDSPQAPMYFALLPEARSFTYLISDGAYLYREHYEPSDFPPIEETVRRFLDYIDRMGLSDIYIDHWKAK